MNQLITNKMKVLKLSNVLINELICEEIESFTKEIAKMDSYIKTKGTKFIGPLIQYINPKLDNNNQIQMVTKLLMQTTTFINHTEQPYKMESIIRIPNCMYCRYIGPEEKLKYAYDKILIEAFEEDIPLKGDSYTIFVDRNKENETVTADVFMERADNE